MSLTAVFKCWGWSSSILLTVLQVVILLTFVLTVGLWNFLSWVGLLVVGKRERITDQIIGKWGLQLCSNPCYRVFVYWPREARLNHTIDIRKKEAKITEIAYVTKRWLHPKMLSHLRWEQQSKIYVTKGKKAVLKYFIWCQNGHNVYEGKRQRDKNRARRDQFIFL